MDRTGERGMSDQSLVINAGLSAWFVVAASAGWRFLLPVWGLGWIALGPDAFLAALIPYVAVVGVAGQRTRLVADREHVLVRNGFRVHRLRADEITRVDIDEGIYQSEGGSYGYCVRLRSRPGPDPVSVLATVGLMKWRFSVCQATAQRIAAFLGCAMAYGPAHLADTPPAKKPHHPQSRSTSGFAIASMVLGILWIFWIGSILALVFGYKARKEIDRSGGAQGGRGMAIAGIALGYVGLAWFLWLLIAV